MMLAVPRAILFGFEGVLVDVLGPRFQALAKVPGEEGVDLTDELLAACPCRPPYEDWLRAVLGRARGAGAGGSAPRLMAHATACYHARLRDRGADWLVGAIGLVERAAAGVHLGVVSGLPRAEGSRLLPARASRRTSR